MKAILILGLAAGALGVNAIGSAATIIQQDFEDTAVFPAGSNPSWGSYDVHGRWVSSNPDGVGVVQPTVVSGSGQSGSQFIQLVRGTSGSATANLSGYGAVSVPATNFEATAWFNRGTDGALTFSTDYPNGPAVYFHDSTLSAKDAATTTAWDATSVTNLPENSWFGVSLQVTDIVAGRYDVLYNDGVHGWTTTATGFSFNTTPNAGIRKLDFNVQGGTVQLDTVSLENNPVPEPTTLGLMGLIGLGALCRRRRK